MKTLRMVLLVLTYCIPLIGCRESQCGPCGRPSVTQITSYDDAGGSTTIQVGGDDPGVSHDPGEEFSSLTAWDILIVCLWAHAAWYAFIKRPKHSASGSFIP